MGEATLRRLGAGAAALVGTGATMLVGLAVTKGFKDSGEVDNPTAEKIETAIKTVGSFLSVVILAFIGKELVAMFRQK